MPFTVVLDACVLLPYLLCDLLLRLADKSMFRPVWSEDILDEVHRNLTGTFNVSLDKATRRVDQMRIAFPQATVDGYQDLISAMTNHPKDRHVLAVGVRVGAAAIVTANLKDFPEAALDPYGIELIHPDEFLLDQLDLDAAMTLRCLNEQRRAYRRPALARAEFFRGLHVTVPQFAGHAELLVREEETTAKDLKGLR